MITIYSTPTCSFCNAAKQYMKSVDVEYEEIDVSEDYEAARKMVAISGQMGVPVIDIDGDITVGLYKPDFEKLLQDKKILA